MQICLSRKEAISCCRAANLGQDFEEQHRRASIPVASFQMWPDRCAMSHDLHTAKDPDLKELTRALANCGER